MSAKREAKLEQLKQQALALPPSAGVYLMKDINEKVIYVGKAKHLPKRLSSYFQKTPPSARIGLMVSKIESFDFVLTATEKESLILENSLIKKYHPRFNVVLRDDKTYPSLRLSLSEDFPRLEIVRRPVKDGSLIFGPFPSASAMRDTVRTVSRIFPLRQCRRPDVKNIARPCLNYQMKRCVGPCRPEVTPKEYARLSEQVRLFFRGTSNELIAGITDDMKAAAESYDFEEAAILRDRLNNIKKTLERQIVEQADNRDLDIFAFHYKDGLMQGSLLMVRKGAVSGCLPLESSGAEEIFSNQLLYSSKDTSGNQQDSNDAKPLGGSEKQEAEFSLIGQYYGADNFVPDELIVPFDLPNEEKEPFEQWLSSLKGRMVKIHFPQRGDKIKLLEMAKENAQAALEDRIGRIGRSRGVMLELQARLGLDKAPMRLECFDLAHLQGRNAVAGLVVMEDGQWKKNHYRRFRIKSAKGGDDYSGMREVVTRRFSHQDWPKPDLLLIDGGKGQLHAAEAAFIDLGLKAPPLAAIAEGKLADIDRIFIPGRKNPLDLKAGSAALLLMSRLRDEAHRYVGSYHRSLELQTFKESPLLSIPGIGPVKRKKLLNHFASLEKMAQARDEEIMNLIKIKSESASALRASLAAYLEKK